jgi:hypothetical protein
MKRILTVGMVIGLSLVLATSVFAAKQKKGGTQKATAKAGSSAFVGTVIAVNAQTKTITVAGKATTVGFDVSKPTFAGYKTLADIKPGDKVSVAYTSDGTQVKKMGGKAAKTDKPASAKKAAKPAAKSGK